VLWNADETEVLAFRFICGMRDFDTTVDQQETTEMMRVLADE